MSSGSGVDSDSGIPSGRGVMSGNGVKGWGRMKRVPLLLVSSVTYSYCDSGGASNSGGGCGSDLSCLSIRSQRLR